MYSEPLISCIMPTRGRPKFASEAIEQFQMQIWRNRELLIIDDDTVPSIFPDIALPENVKLWHRRRMTIGAKRNYACGLAAGSIIAHWDDDDIYATDRLEHQARILLGSDAEIIGYCPLRFTEEGVADYLYSNPRPDYAPGATLMYVRSAWESRPFKDLSVNEDGDFLVGRKNVVVVPGEDHMVARIHSGNTSPRKLQHTRQWRRIA
ncbi:MAG: hypothetical protein A2Z18_11080 [Armatimonadetes bacterium RBG_16_58_9]|nr:MAG: hypothetical protein A2Z18_11080 [Armatimonadetes bacterium RBG_16_58_9]